MRERDTERERHRETERVFGIVILHPTHHSPVVLIHKTISHNRLRHMLCWSFPKEAATMNNEQTGYKEILL